MTKRQVTIIATIVSIVVCTVEKYASVAVALAQAALP